MKQPFKTTITIMANSQAEADQAAKQLEEIAANIEHDNLKTLAKKSKVAGINQKIRTFANFI